MLLKFILEIEFLVGVVYSMRHELVTSTGLKKKITKKLYNSRVLFHDVSKN